MSICKSKKNGDCEIENCEHGEDHDFCLSCAWFQNKCKCVPEKEDIECI